MTPPIERPGPNSTLGEARAYLAATALGVKDLATALAAKDDVCPVCAPCTPIRPGPDNTLGEARKYLAAVGGLHGNITCPLCGQHKPRRRNGKRKSKVSR